MDEVCNGACHINKLYENTDLQARLVDGVADHITQDLNPKTVLGIGCTASQLIAALRNKKIEAYGINVPAASIAEARADIRPFLRTHTLTEDGFPEDLPQRFDLVLSIHALEYIHETDLPQVIQKLCSLSDYILFSASYIMQKEAQANVHQTEYWAKQFALRGFFRDLTCAALNISSDIMHFSRQPNLPVAQLAEGYERFLRLERTRGEESLRTKNWRSYTTALAFDSGDGFTTDTLTQKALDPNFSWAVNMPLQDVQSIQFIPTVGQSCILENLQITAGGITLPLTDSMHRPLGHTAPLYPPGQPVFAPVNLPQGMQQPAHLSITATIHVVDTPYHIHVMDQLEQNSKTLLATQKKLQQISEKEQAAQALIKKIDRQYQDMADEKDHIINTIAQERDQWAERASNSEQLYQAVTHSSSWFITKPFRWLTRGLAKAVRGVCLRVPFLRGPYAWFAAARKLGCKTVRFNKEYYGALEGPPSPVIPGAAEMQREMAASTPPDIIFSIAVAFCNPSPLFLEDMIRSVQRQSYSGWQLCLADSGDNDGAGDIAHQYAKNDARILYKKLPVNLDLSDAAKEAIAMATGDYVVLLNHNDILNLNALYEMRQAICEQQADFLYSDDITFQNNNLADTTTVALKPDFAPDTLRSWNYIGSFVAFKRALMDKVGEAFREGYDGSQIYDLILRLTEQAGKIVHIAKILCFVRAHATSGRPDLYVTRSAQKAIASHLERLGIPGKVEASPAVDNIYRIHYAIKGNPLVSIIIPNKDQVETLAICIDSILKKTTWANYEIILCENNSTKPEIFEYYEELAKIKNIRLITWEKAFNYSSINNFAAEHAKGDYLILLNNDTEIISASWIEEMLMFCQRPEVGAVGGKLYYTDDTLQHGGIVIGIMGIASHTQVHYPRDNQGYMYNLTYARNVSCVTAACMMIRKEVFFELGGLNPKFEVTFNDLDLCMRMRAAGYLIVFTPFAELYHDESKSRGSDYAPQNHRRFAGEVHRFQCLWSKEIAKGDPYHNPNLRRDTSEYVVDFAKLRAPQ